LTDWFVAALPPKVTAVAPVKPVPVMLTLVTLETGPYVGETELTVGATIYANPPALVPAPPGVVTVTSFTPAVPAGVLTLRWVSSFTVRFVAAFPPKVTAVAPVKSVPVMVTFVTPASGPEPGETEVTVGAAW
jgi:hypothetical protein